jgi:pectate lyase
MKKLLIATLIIAGILYGYDATHACVACKIVNAQSFDITCEGGTIAVTPLPNGGTRLICVEYTPTPLPTGPPLGTATSTSTPTRTPVPPTATPIPPTATGRPLGTPIPSTSTPIPPTAPAVSGPVVAFPGAEGWGAASLGGRGGSVIEVTNLNDAGTGSLRACIIATGKRTCVFKVAGTITLATRLTITSPFITIAGQTAPGGGIAIRNGNNLQAPIAVNTNNVIIRHLRLRPGPPVKTSSTVDGITIFGTSKYVILDHLTISWSADEAVNAWDSASDITVQWSLLYNELCNGWHGDGHPHCDSILFGSNSTRITAHHNLLAHNDMRNPRITGGEVDFVNNVIYDAGTTPSRMFAFAGTGPAQLNYVGNYIKRGPDSYYTEPVFKCTSFGGRGIGCYVSGNTVVPVVSFTDAASLLNIVPTRYPFPQVTTTSALVAYDDVLDSAGATKPVRDSMDVRVTNEVRDGTGGFIDHPSEVGGWPTLATGTGYVDSDHDGIEDSPWEADHGLTVGVNDSALVMPSGYTALEEYINWLAR